MHLFVSNFLSHGRVIQGRQTQNKIYIAETVNWKPWQAVNEWRMSHYLNTYRTFIASHFELNNNSKLSMRECYLKK